MEERIREGRVLILQVVDDRYWGYQIRWERLRERWLHSREDNGTLWLAEIVKDLAWGVFIQSGQGYANISCMQV